MSTSVSLSLRLPFSAPLAPCSYNCVYCAAGPLLFIARRVAEAQDRHFSLTSAWMETSPAIATDLVNLQKKKQMIEQAIAQQQAFLAELTLNNNPLQIQPAKNEP